MKTFFLTPSVICVGASFFCLHKLLSHVSYVDSHVSSQQLKMLTSYDEINSFFTFQYFTLSKNICHQSEIFFFNLYTLTGMCRGRVKKKEEANNHKQSLAGWWMKRRKNSFHCHVGRQAGRHMWHHKMMMRSTYTRKRGSWGKKHGERNVCIMTEIRSINYEILCIHHS